MSSVATPNLVGITGLARRLVMDGHLSEADARTAIDEATKIKQPIHAYLAEKRLASAAQIAMAQSSEFGMPIFDVGSLDINQAPVKLVDEKLINAHKGERGLSEDEFGYFVILLTVAGNETTRNAITHGMNAFFDNPEQWEIWKRDRPATMIDEVVRWATPVNLPCWSWPASSRKVTAIPPRSSA